MDIQSAILPWLRVVCESVDAVLKTNCSRFKPVPGGTAKQRAGRDGARASLLSHAFPIIYGLPEWIIVDNGSPMKATTWTRRRFAPVRMTPLGDDWFLRLGTASGSVTAVPIILRRWIASDGFAACHAPR